MQTKSKTTRDIGSHAQTLRGLFYTNVGFFFIAVLGTLWLNPMLLHINWTNPVVKAEIIAGATLLSALIACILCWQWRRKTDGYPSFSEYNVQQVRQNKY
jgi:hypothetical protein